MEEPSAIPAIVELLASAVGFVGVAFILVGCLLGFAQYLGFLASKRRMSSVKLTLGTYMLVGLEFLIGQDVIETVFDPGLEKLARIGLIVAIRTVLEHFLGREVAELEEEEERHEKAATSSISR